MRSPPDGEAAAIPGASQSPDALTPPPGNPRFPLFDGLRALAALSILVFHTGAATGTIAGQAGLGPYLAQLKVGVAVFFVISGFLLYRPFVAARTGGAPAVRLGAYLRRRFLRIVPAYWVALTLLAVYPGLSGTVFGGQWWIFYGFAQDYSPYTVLSGIPAAWSLGCEVVFYILLPVIALALAYGASRFASRTSWRFELGVLLLLSLLSAGWRAYADAHPTISTATLGSTFGWFALGMGLAVVSVELARRPDLARRVASRSWLGWVAAAGAYLVLSRGLGLSTVHIYTQAPTVAQDLAIYALSGVVAAGLALPAAFEPSPAGLIGRILGARPLAWLGLVSYGIFLYQLPIATKLNGGVTGGAGATLRFLWLTPATAALTIAAGAASYYVVERPALRFKERRARTVLVRATKQP